MRYKPRRDPWDSRPREDYADDPIPPPEIPRIDRMPRVVDYSDRGPKDFVVSGPLYPNLGPGRPFDSVTAAMCWAKKKYGEDNIKLVKACLDMEATRWAILVKRKV